MSTVVQVGTYLRHLHPLTIAQDLFGTELFAMCDQNGIWIKMSGEREIVHNRPLTVWPHESRTLNLWGRAIMRS